MKVYEITYITLDEPKTSPVAEAIAQLGGKVLHESALGQKQFAYPIKKEVRGFYTSYVFEIEAEKVIELDRKITLHEEILRHLVIKFEGSVENLMKPVAKKAEAPKAEVVEAPVEIKEEVVTEVVEEPSTAEEVVIPTEEIVEEKIEEPVVAEKVEEPKKEVKKEIVKEEVKAVKPKINKPKKEVLPEPENEEERLKALDKKLDELLKD